VIKFIYEHRISQWVTVILWIVALRAIHYYFYIHDSNGSNLFIERGLFRSVIDAINTQAHWSFFISTLLLIVQGLIIRYLVWEYNALDKSGYSVLFFYGNLSLLFNGHLYLHYVSIGSFFLLLGIWYFYRFLSAGYYRVFLFFSAFFMGISALAVPEFFWSLVFLVLMVMAFKASEALDVFVIVFGFLMPYYLLSSVGYLLGAPLDFKSTLLIWNGVKIPGTSFFHQLGLIEIGVLCFVILFGLYGSMKIFGSYYRHNIDARRSRLAMAFFSLFLLLIWLLNFQAFPDFFLLLCIPLSVYTSQAFQSEKGTLFRNILFYLYVVVVLAGGFFT